MPASQASRNCSECLLFHSVEQPWGGGCLDRTAVHRIVKSAVTRARLPPGISAQWMRDAHASHTLDRKVPVSLVQASLGHASLSTTGRYLHARPGDGSARYLGL